MTVEKNYEYHYFAENERGESVAVHVTREAVGSMATKKKLSGDLRAVFKALRSEFDKIASDKFDLVGGTHDHPVFVLSQDVERPAAAKEKKSPRELIDLIIEQAPELSGHHIQIFQDPLFGWIPQIYANPRDVDRKLQKAEDAARELRKRYDLKTW